MNNKELEISKEVVDLCLIKNLTITAALKEIARRHSKNERRVKGNDRTNSTGTIRQCWKNEI